jgi:hypothetical protein
MMHNAAIKGEQLVASPARVFLRALLMALLAVMYQNRKR